MSVNYIFANRVTGHECGYSSSAGSSLILEVFQVKGGHCNDLRVQFLQPSGLTSLSIVEVTVLQYSSAQGTMGVSHWGKD